MKYLRKLLLVAFTIPLFCFSSGCNQNEIGALANTLGTSAANIAKLEGNSALSAKLTADTAAAVSAIDNWKSGTPATDAIEALNLVEDDLQLIPGTSQYAPLIDLCIGTAESILDLLPQTPSATPAIAPHASRRVVKLDNPPRTAKEFKKQFNALAPPNLKIK